MLTCHWPPVRSLRPPKMNIKDPWGRKSRKWWEIMVPLPNCLTYGSCWVEVPVHWGLTNTGLRNRRIEARILVWLKRKFTSSFQVMFVRSSLYTSCPNLNKVYSFNVSTIHILNLDMDIYRVVFLTGPPKKTKKVPDPWEILTLFRWDLLCNLILSQF